MLRIHRLSLLALFFFIVPISHAHAYTTPQTSSASSTSADSPQSMSRDEAVRILSSNRKIVTPLGIEETLKVRIGGINQWISVRGKNRRNPILLFLHGGPASPAMPEAYSFQTPWEDYFTVVQWDQRGAGKTYRANTEQSMAHGMTLEGQVNDALQMIAYLRQRYGKQKIFVLGHSWGSVLGVEVAQRHPEWLYAYISVGQVVNGRRNEEVGYAFALQQAQVDHNMGAVKELEAIAPYPGDTMTIDRIGVRSKWEMYYGGLAYGRHDYQFESDLEELSPDYSEDDLDAMGKGSLFSLHYLLQPLMAVNFDHVTHLQCPVLVFVGAHDYTTPYELTEKWFTDIQAPSKRLVIFADSAHMVMQDQPGRFLVHLVDDALPFAKAAGDVTPAEVTRDR